MALQPPVAQPQPPPNTAVLHYRRSDNAYQGWGLHLWDGNANPVEWNNPMPPTGIDSFGAYWHIPLVPGATGVSYIVHRGDEKDLPNDQRLAFGTFGREAWILSGRQAYLRPEAPAQRKDIDLTKSYAQWLDRGTIAWAKKPHDGKVYELIVAPEGGLSIVDGQLKGSYYTVVLSAGVLSATGSASPTCGHTALSPWRIPTSRRRSKHNSPCSSERTTEKSCPPQVSRFQACSTMCMPLPSMRNSVPPSTMDARSLPCGLPPRRQSTSRSTAGSGR